MINSQSIRHWKNRFFFLFKHWTPFCLCTLLSQFHLGRTAFCNNSRTVFCNNLRPKKRNKRSYLCKKHCCISCIAKNINIASKYYSKICSKNKSQSTTMALISASHISVTFLVQRTFIFTPCYGRHIFQMG